MNCRAEDRLANYRGRPAHIRLAKQKEERVSQQLEQQRFQQMHANTLRTPDLNFAHAMRNRTTTNLRHSQESANVSNDQVPKLYSTRM